MANEKDASFQITLSVSILHLFITGKGFTFFHLNCIFCSVSRFMVKYDCDQLHL